MHNSIIDLLDGYFMCRACKKVAPKHTMSKHSTYCDIEVEQDLTTYDKELTRYFDLLLIIDYYHNPKPTNHAIRKRIGGSVTASFPDIMIRKLKEKVREQMFVCRQIDHNQHTHPSHIEKEEILTIKNCIKLKRLECLSEIY
jgi:hypothetical protein